MIELTPGWGLTRADKRWPYKEWQLPKLSYIHMSTYFFEVKMSQDQASACPVVENAKRCISLKNALMLTNSRWLPTVKVVAIHVVNSGCCEFSKCHGGYIDTHIMPHEEYQIWRGPEFTRDPEYKFMYLDMFCTRENRLARPVPHIVLVYTHRYDLYVKNQPK